MLQYIVLCLVVGYALGCFSTGYFIGKANNVDLSKHGSGNNGTTNALRTMGVKAGILTLLGDACKAIIPIVVFRMLWKNDPTLSKELITLYVGLGVVLGHNFPFWLRFKGGKGIAAMGGVIICFSLPLTLVAIIVFFAVVALTRYVSLGSLLVSIIFPLGVVVLQHDNPRFLHMLIICCIFTLSAFIKHRANIVRLIHGTENKIGQKININK